MRVVKNADEVVGSATDLATPNTYPDLFRKLILKKADIKMVNDAANQVGVDRKGFGNYIHELKK